MSKKSKDLIVQSFWSILQNNPYEAITICEVIAETPLERKTFYNNFKNKEDIIRYICSDLMEKLISRLKEGKIVTLHTFSETFYSFGKEHHEVFTVLLKKNIFYFFVEELKYSISNLEDISEDIIQPESNLRFLENEDIAYVFFFHATGTLALFELWVASGFKKSEAEMVNMQAAIYKMYENKDTVDIDLWK